MAERKPTLTEFLEFLLARIADDEAVARAASKGRVWTWDDRGEDLMSEHTYPIGSMTGQECIIATEGANPPDPEIAGAHIARHDPARVLADCAAKRRIVEEYVDICKWDTDAGDDHGIHGQRMGLEFAVKVLAAACADHPDYRAEWRP